MRYRLSHLRQMTAEQLLDHAHYVQDDITSTPLETALAEQLKSLVDQMHDKELIEYSAVKDTMQEVAAQLPDEDFLAEAIKLTGEIAKGKLTKRLLVEKAQELTESLEALAHEQANATEYAIHEIESLLDHDY